VSKAIVFSLAVSFTGLHTTTITSTV